MSEATVGQIIGYLRLDADQYFRELNKAERAADNLARKSPNIKVDVDASSAIAQLKAVDAAENKVDASNKRLSSSSRQSALSLRAMATAIITLGPALVPVAAAAVGAGGALVTMGAVGVLAVKGVQDEMEKGTALGSAYAANLGVLDAGFTTLKRTAASGVLAGFQTSVAQVSAQIPFLNTQVGIFSGILGRSANNLLTGAIAGLHTLQPLLLTSALYVENLSARFAAAGSGSGLQAFADYARSVLPQVTAALESLVGATVKLVAAFAPLGLGVLGILRTLSDVIRAIPLPVLTVLATSATAVFIAFRTWQGLSGVVATLTTKLGLATAATRTLSIAAGGISAILGVATLAYTLHASKVAEDQRYVDALTDSLDKQSGALTEVSRQTAFTALQQSGAIETAKQLGVSLKTVVDASLGVAGAQERLAVEVSTANARFTDSSAGTKLWAKSVDDAKIGASALGAGITGASTAINTAGPGVSQLTATTKQLAEQAKLSGANWRDQAAAIGGTTPVVDAATAALNRQAAVYGITGAALRNVQTAQASTATATAAATLQMRAQNDAAGLLKQTLDLLNGKALSAAEAQNAFDSSLVNMGTHVSATGKKITFTTTSINNMSSASVALRGQLNGQVANLQRVIEANGGLANATGQAKAQMKLLRQQIIDNAVAHGVGRVAATKYIDKILKTPKSVPTTFKENADAARAKVEALTASAKKVPNTKSVFISAPGAVQAATDVFRVRGQVDMLRGKTITITTRLERVTINSIINKNATDPRIPGNASGGTVGGTGGPRADNQLILASPGEEIIRNGPAQRYRGLLKAINAGQAFQGGGTVLSVPVRHSTPAAVAASPGGSTVMPAVYVQNPFTGEYLLAKVATVADDRASAAVTAQSRRILQGTRF